jgi:large repetitive protein
MKKLNGKVLSLFLSVLVFSPFLVAAQSTDFTWYIGNRIIEFHRLTNEPTATNNPVTLQGTGAVVTNPNGDILFYTDGQTIYDALNQPMPSPNNNLNADPAKNQSVVVARHPGNPNQYYVITNSPTGVIEATIVDMTLQGNPATLPLGDVFSPPTQVAALAGQSDGMITIANGNNFYLITHEAGTTNYNVTSFSAGGIITNTVAAGSITNVSNMAWDPETNQLAIAPSNANQNIEIISFPPNTGALSFVGALPNTFSTVPGAINDVEWGPLDPDAPGDRDIYISTINSSGQSDLLQYPLSNMTTTDPLIAPVSVLPQPNTITASYGLQIGPDSAVYHLYQQGGQIRMGKLVIPDDPAIPLSYVPQAIPGSFTETQFPATLPGQDVQVNVSFTYGQPCVNVPTQLFPTISQTVDSVQWVETPAGTVISDEWSPIHTFEGPLDVTLNAYIDGKVVGSFTQTITPTPFDVQIQPLPEVVACMDEFLHPIGEPPGWPGCGTKCVQVEAQITGTGNIQWFGSDGPIDGATAATFSPESPGYYWVEVTAGNCTAYQGVLVRQYDEPDPRLFNWYFGNQAGIDFNPTVLVPPGEPIDISASSGMNAPEGTATVSDRNGKVVFYTDGESVWLRDNPTTPITTNLGGDNTATQSSLIMPVGTDETLYYIFTTQENSTGGYELRYAVFDRRLDPVNGVGGLVDPTPLDPLDPPSTVLFTKSTERILGVDNWVIVHEYGTNTFRAYQVTEEGIGSPVFSNVGSDHQVTAPSTGTGYMTYVGGKIIVGVTEADGTSFIEILDFDGGSGEVSNPVRVEVPDAYQGQIYGVHMSPNSDRLYATILGHNKILEFQLDDPLDDESWEFLGEINVPPGQPGAMQYGLGSQLFVAIQGHNGLGMISFSSQQDVLSTLILDQPKPLTGESTLGLPNFVQQEGTQPGEPGLAPATACVNQEVTLVATPKEPTIDQFNWYFHDGTAERDAEPEITRTYTQAGTYQVRVLIYNKCQPILNPNAQGDPTDFNNPGGVGLFTVDVVVHDTPKGPIWFIPGDNTFICDGNPVTLRGYDPSEYDPAVNPGDLTFQWSNGSTADHIDVTQAGTYTVTATNQFGCAATNSQEVNPYFTINIGPDIIVCQDDEIDPLVAGFDNRATYAWTIDGTPVATPSPANELAVNTSVAKATPFVYRVTLTNAAINCSVSDEALVTVNATPQYTATPTDAVCNDPANRGRIDLVGAPLNLPYTVVNGAGAISNSGIITNNPQTISNLVADTYLVNITIPSTGCDNPKTVTVDDSNYTIDAAQLGTCHPGISFDVTLTTGVGITPASYEIRDASNLPVRGGPVAAFPISTDALPDALSGGGDGTYTITVTDQAGCKATTTETVDTDEIDISIEQTDICALTNQVSLLSAPAATSIQWFVNGTLSGSDNTLTLQPGTWDVRVIASGAGANACPDSREATITIAQPINVDFEQSSACIRPVVLTASPVPTTPSLEWYLATSPTPQLIGTGRTIQVTQTPTEDIFVTAISSTGCPYTSAAKPVNVVEPFEMSIETQTDPICEGSDYILDAIATPPTTINDYVWTFNGSEVSGNSSDQLTDTRAGTYTVMARASGCEYTSPPFSVTPGPIPSVDLGPLKRICPEVPVNRTATLDPGQYQSYQWSFDAGSGAVLLPFTSQTITADQEGIYLVEVTDETGCSNTDQVQVIAECDPILDGPNAFHPKSSDPMNQIFQLFHFFISEEDFQILIFNRWGEMVYQSTDPNFNWNGGYKGDSGKLLPPGTYAYVVRYKSRDFPEQGIKEKRGGVVLIQ